MIHSVTYVGLGKFTQANMSDKSGQTSASERRWERLPAGEVPLTGAMTINSLVRKHVVGEYVAMSYVDNDAPARAHEREHALDHSVGRYVEREIDLSLLVDRLVTWLTSKYVIGSLVAHVTLLDTVDGVQIAHHILYELHDGGATVIMYTPFTTEQLTMCVQRLVAKGAKRYTFRMHMAELEDGGAPSLSFFERFILRSNDVGPSVTGRHFVTPGMEVFHGN